MTEPLEPGLYEAEIEVKVEAHVEGSGKSIF